MSKEPSPKADRLREMREANIERATKAAPRKKPAKKAIKRRKKS